ncbi:acyltransferase [bacterium SCSIO 12643]|nr:acyltransferase [bacterium SCSIO 12643]
MIISKILNKITGLIFKLYSILINWLIFSVEGVDYSRFPKVAGRINVLNRGKIALGKQNILTSSNKSNPVGGGSNTSIYCSPGGNIKIDDNVAISNSVIFSQKSIHIKSGAMIGGGCQIYDTDFHSLKWKERLKIEDEKIKTAPVIIEENAFLGCNVIVLKGSVIGKNSIIGAGSVVKGKIPENEIWGGNPAKYIKSIT